MPNTPKDLNYATPTIIFTYKSKFDIIGVSKTNVLSKFNEYKVQRGIPPKSKVTNWSTDK